MQPPPTHSNEIARQIRELLEVHALRDVPRVMSRMMSGERCVIWKPSRHLARCKGMSDEQFGHLYPYSSDFPEQRGIQHAGIPLEIDKDTTDRFYRSRKSSDFIDNFVAKDVNSKGAEFIDKERLCRVCMARFEMPIEDGGQFAVSVYRRKDQDPFSQNEAETLKALASILPTLYQKLISVQFKDAVDKANVVLRAKCERLEDARQPLEQLCKLLAECFNIREVSVFLNDPFSGGQGFRCFGSTIKDQLMKQSYTASKSDGLTGYVLATQERIWFHDLHNFDDPVVTRRIDDRHPGINMTDGARFKQLANVGFNLPPGSGPPPLSFLGVPIVGEGKNSTTFGALRASLGINPFHFLDAQMKVFEIIASEIGRWWESIIDMVKQERRGDVWKAINNSMIAQQNYLRSSDDMDGLCRAVVESITAEPGFDLACFRRGREANALKVSAIAFKRDEHGMPAPYLGDHQVRLGDLVPLTADMVQPERARGFLVQVIDRSAAELPGEESSLCVGLARVVSFPVFIKNILYGVLDIGFGDDRAYTPAKERIAEFGSILARQLALFERIKEGVAEVEKAQENEIKTYAAVTHQLKTPLFTASNRLKNLNGVVPSNWTYEHSKTLLRAGGMVRKARNVTNLIEILGLLVARKPIKTKNMVRVYPQAARLLCLEVAQNSLGLVDERMDTDFILKPELWGNFPVLSWDHDFAEQCLDAVINNAFKYSAVSQMIGIQGLAEGHRYVIRVTNRGPYHISETETADCLNPYWRGKKAKEREGAGIGLWVAKALMEAQGGEITVHPTNTMEETIIELRFALERATHDL